MIGGAMSRRVLVSLMIVAFAMAAIGAGTFALYSDTETSASNTFTAGTLDLTVDGADEPLPMVWDADNMVPGGVYDGGVVEVRNNGSVAGKVTLEVANVVSNENGLLEPERTWTLDPIGPVNNSGQDLDGVQVDPTGFNQNGGDGELWDQMGLHFYVDTSGTGGQSGPPNGKFDWWEPVIFSSAALDMTTGSAYYIPLNTNLFPADHGFDEVLEPGESFKIGLLYRFFNDNASIMNSQPQFGIRAGQPSGLNNNMAMSDDAVFDIKFGLVQAP